MAPRLLSLAHGTTAASLLLAALPCAMAQVTTIPEFSGEHATDFSNVPLGLMKSRMTTAGFVTTRNLHGLDGVTTAGVAPHELVPAFGDRMLSTSDGNGACTIPDKIRWRPIQSAEDIGLHLGTDSSGDTPITVQLEDENGVIFSTTQAVLPGDGAWTWVGLHSDIEIERVIITNSRANGGVHIVIDAMTSNEPGDGSIGTEFGDASANSTGMAATISATGSSLRTDADLVLRADQVPNHAFGLFLYSPDRGNTPMGDGTLWLGTGQLRRMAVTQAVGGVLEQQVDFAASTITAGTTWHFQAYYRDPAMGGAGVNLSHGLSISFE